MQIDREGAKEISPEELNKEIADAGDAGFVATETTVVTKEDCGDAMVILGVGSSIIGGTITITPGKPRP